MLAETRPTLAAMISLGVLFASGAIGAWLAQWRAPDSWITAILSFLALPVAFMLSLLLWQGMTALVMLVKFLLGRGHWATERSSLEALANKAFLLVPLPIIFSFFSGLIAALLGDYGFFSTLVIYLFSGGAFGMGCYFLGRAGMFPMFDD